MGDIDYQSLRLEYKARKDAGRLSILVVGAGPVGLTLALDLAQRGINVCVIDDDERLSTGSRAICFAKRTLDIWDRLGVGERMVRKGVSWNVGRVFFRNEEVWRFDLLPEQGHRRPAFINLQQYYCEGYLYEAAQAHPNIALHFRHKAVGVSQSDTGVTVDVETPDGHTRMEADWVIACDGARSPMRKMLGQEAHGRVFKDRFLIADVRMHADFPTERWFWFDPPFHRGQSVLLHSQPDNVWRIDFQLGWEADPTEAAKPENVRPRIQALLGEHVKFELEWVSVYTFACERMDHFRHGRIFFAGDAAHRVSPFGARGANSGIQDADNLGWKLALVVQGKAPISLLDSYAQEREPAADENIAHSSRSTDFITPKSEISRLFRNMVLKLAKRHDFARALINSGRLSTPTCYWASPLNTPDTDGFTSELAPGAVAPDGPIMVDGSRGWWLSQLRGKFTLAVFCNDRYPDDASLQLLQSLKSHPLDVQVILVLAPGMANRSPTGLPTVEDFQMTLVRRYDALDSALYLIRPDQHIAARWRHIKLDHILDALDRVSTATEAA